MAAYTNTHQMFSDIIPITPSDTTSITSVCATEDQVGLYIATGGNLTVEMASGNNRTVVVTDGSNFYGKVLKVLSTGTTASGISLMVA